MPKPPQVHELEFIRITQNHGEFSKRLSSIQVSNGADDMAHAQHVGLCWFKLGEEHLAEAKTAAAGGTRRSAYSRAYYAVYNVSKATRYLVNGVVSLKGDDHKQASVLPDDFPDAVRWAIAISSLYQNRLRADYDNWSTTAADFDMPVPDAITSSETCVSAARTYLVTKFG